MKVFKSHKIAIFNLIFILLSSIALTGCVKYELFVPEYHHFNPPPKEITTGQLMSEYMVDEVTADATYKGERLLFYEIEVEQVDGYWVYIGLGEWIFEKTFFISGSIKFRLWGEDYGIMQSIKEGYVLNVVGECKGLVSGGLDREPLILVYDCWVESVIGDLGSVDWEPPMY